MVKTMKMTGIRTQFVKKTCLLLLAVIMAAGFLIATGVVTAQTAYADTDGYNLWVGGSQVTSDNLFGEGWRYYPESNTLTLNGFNYSGSGHLAASTSSSQCGCIFYGGEGPFNLMIKGNNSITNTNQEVDRAYGIYCASDLTINGTGTLITFSTEAYDGIGINCIETVKINNDTSNASCKISATGNNYGINSQKGLFISGGIVEAKGASPNNSYGINGTSGELLTIGENVQSVVISGTGRAVSGLSVKNDVEGIGWTDTTGTEGGSVINISEQGQDLSTYKKLQFPAVAKVTASDGVVANYANWNKAVEAWNAHPGSTLTLLKDITVGVTEVTDTSSRDPLTLTSNFEGTLELNGHILSNKGTDMCTVKCENGADLTIKDTNGGKITSCSGNAPVISGDPTSRVNITGGSFTTTSAPYALAGPSVDLGITPDLGGKGIALVKDASSISINCKLTNTNPIPVVLTNASMTEKYKGVFTESADHSNNDPAKFSTDIEGCEVLKDADSGQLFIGQKFDVTFKVKNGVWNNDNKEDERVTVSGYTDDMMKLKDDQIPSVGKNPDKGYEAGSWDVTPSVETVITGNTTYTYTYEPAQSPPSATSIDNAPVVLDSAPLTYTGQPVTPVIQTIGGKTLQEGRDYTIRYTQGDTVIEAPTDAGTYTMTITGKGNYAGSTSTEFTIGKADGTLTAQGNKVKVKSKTVKLKKAKKISAEKAYTIEGAIGELAFSKVKVNKKAGKFKVNAKSGQVKVKKGLKKGKYELTVLISDSGDKNHEEAEAEAIVKIIVEK